MKMEKEFKKLQRENIVIRNRIEELVKSLDKDLRIRIFTNIDLLVNNEIEQEKECNQ